jgi:hypothetical protein
VDFAVAEFTLAHGEGLLCEEHLNFLGDCSLQRKHLLQEERESELELSAHSGGFLRQKWSVLIFLNDACGLTELRKAECPVNILRQYWHKVCTEWVFATDESPSIVAEGLLDLQLPSNEGWQV